MRYRLDRKIDIAKDYRQLLMDLTVKELQRIRKNWGFEGISHLNKAEMAGELCSRIPLSLEVWLKSITSPLFDFLKENLSKKDLIFIDIQSERDFKVLEYLQQYGVVFYGSYEGSIVGFIPDEIKDNLRYIFSHRSEIRTCVKQNTELVSITIGFLVYYGVYSAIKIPEIIEPFLNYRLKSYHYFKVIEEFIKAYDILLYYQGNLILKYVINPEWVLEEQDVRTNLDYYSPDRNEIMHAGENLIPPYNKEYKAINNYLRKNRLSNQEIDDILLGIYLKINNDISFHQIIQDITDKINIYGKKSFYQLSTLILAAYNNTNQWVLKGNNPEDVHNIPSFLQEESKEEDIKEKSFNKVDRNDKIVDIKEFRKYKEDNTVTVKKEKK